MIEPFWDWLQNTDLAFAIGATWWFPFIESLHVVGVALVLGAILAADLRLLGVNARGYATLAFVRELTPWAWGGFVLAAVTGAGMFITRPSTYAANPAFQVKLLLLALAGLNVLVLHRGVMRRIDAWGENNPYGARAAGALSICLWIGVALAGRWTGHLQ